MEFAASCIKVKKAVGPVGLGMVSVFSSVKTGFTDETHCIACR